MNIWQVEATIMPKDGVNDPQGEAINGGLVSLEFDQVRDVRAGKVIVITLKAVSRDDALEVGKRMCEQLLANPVIETFSLAATKQPAAPANEEPA